MLLTTGIINTAQLVSDVGVMVVISSLFIILFWKQYQQLQNFLTDYVEHMKTEVDTIMNDKEKVKEQQHTEYLDLRMSLSEKIEELLSNLTNYSGASRSYVMELHNSQNNLNGLPFAKFTMTYEYYIDGQAPIIRDFQNMSSSVISPIIGKLYSDTYFEISNTDKLSGDARTIGWFLIRQNAKSSLFVPLKNSNEKIYGILAIDFPEELSKIQKLEIIKKRLWNYAARISGLLDIIKDN